jgi:uncharacterized membrane protein
MTLSPDEERVFDAIVAELTRGRLVGIPWPAVIVSVALVGLLAVAAVLLGLGAGLVELFCASFVLALGVGLVVLTRAGRRPRRR